METLDDLMKNVKSTYWSDLRSGVQTLWGGLGLSVRHLRKSTKKWAQGGIEEDDYFKIGEGLVTLQYPLEKLPVPDHGRYKLHNEIDDCIVCDKCAKICPVNCIDIEPIRATEEIGKTSDGTSKRIYAARFDIDMAKCCFCGLCTTVCPTECLTMTNDYDFSTFSVKEHNFEFAEMTPLEILEKKRAFEESQLAKQKASDIKATQAVEAAPSANEKPVFRPKMPQPKQAEGETGAASAPAKPIFRPKMPVKQEAPAKSLAEGEKQSGEEINKPAFRPRPIIKPKDEE